MFRITKDELKTIMMSQNVISRWGGARKLERFEKVDLRSKIFIKRAGIYFANMGNIP